MYNLSDRPKIIINKQEQLKFLVENKPRHKIETLHKMPSIIGLQPHGPALKNSQYFLNKDRQYWRNDTKVQKLTVWHMAGSYENAGSRLQESI